MALRKRFLLLGALASLVAACSGDDSAPAGTGGNNLPDGSPDARPETGPTGGSGGTGGTGGTIRDSAVVDGDGFTTCSTPVYTHVSTFGAIFDDWNVAANSSPNLAVGFSREAEAATGTTLELDRTDGFPVLGSAKLTIPFDGVSPLPQQLLFAKLYSGGVNMSGTTITAAIKLDSGLNVDPVNTGRAYLVLKSGAGYAYAPGTSTPLDSSAGWITISINADAPLPVLPFGYTACDIREIDVVIETGVVGTYQTAVVHIDTISINTPGGEAGTDSDAAAEAAVEAGQGSREAGSDASSTGDAADTSLPDGRRSDAGSDAAEVGPDAAE
jgi:hypothetical protein